MALRRLPDEPGQDVGAADLEGSEVTEQILGRPDAQGDAAPIVGSIAVDGRADGALAVHEDIEGVHGPSVPARRTIPRMPDDRPRVETALRILTKALVLTLQVPAYAVGRWCDAWESEAARRGLEPSAQSWEDGIRWIVAKGAAGEQPPT